MPVEQFNKFQLGQFYLFRCDEPVKQGIPNGIPCFFVLEQYLLLRTEGYETEGLMARSFKCSRRRWRKKGVLEKAKTRSIGHGSVRDDYVLRVQAAKPRELVQGLGSRLGRCFCALHRGVHRTPAPLP